MATYVDFGHTGKTDQKGNLTVLKDQEALSNAIKLWICSFRGERLYRPNKGGMVVGSLLKPMSEERASEMERAIKSGLRTDFIPSIEVSKCKVAVDYENAAYHISVEGYCPSFKASVTAETTLKSLYK